MRHLFVLLTLSVLLLANSYSVDETVDRLKSAIESRGITIFNIIDHHQNAKDVSMDMSEAKVIIFGNPKAGTNLINENILVAYELPLKFLVYSDNNQTKIFYKSVSEIANSYNLDKNFALYKNMDSSLDEIVKEAIR